MSKTISDAVKEEEKEVESFEERAKKFALETSPIAEKYGVLLDATFASSHNVIKAVPTLADAWSKTESKEEKS